MAVKGKMLPLSDFFSSLGHLIDGHIFSMGEDDKVEEEGLIYKKTEGRGATNWTMLELPEVTMLEK